MLTLDVTLPEMFDEEKQEFIPGLCFRLELEHSLVSLSKWESFFKKPFLSSEKSKEELFWYVKAMVLTKDVPEIVYEQLVTDHVEAIKEYIEDPMTATTFSNIKKVTAAREIITSEIIYYWMTAFNIRWTCEDWHLNRLMTLIRVCNEKSSPPQKLSPQEMADQRRRINEANKARLGTKG